MSELSVQNMWAMYVASLSRATQLPSFNNLMLAGTALPAQLNTETETVDAIPGGQALSQVYSLGNSMPEWGKVDGKNAGLFYARTLVGIFNQYSSFIRSIKLQGDPDPAVKAKLNKDKKQLDAATADYFKLYDQALADYEKRKNQFPDWEAFLKRTPWGNRLTQANAAVDATQSEYDRTMRQAYGAQFDQLARAINLIRRVETDLITGSGDLVMKIQDDAGSLVVPRYSTSLLGQGGGTGYSAWLDQAVEAAANKVPPEVVIQVQQGAQQYNLDQLTFSWRGKASYFPFIGFKTKGKYEEIKVNTDSSEFSIEITMQSVTTVTLTPGQWFMGEFLTNFRKPENFWPDTPFAKSPIWGPGGIFNVLPTGLVICFRPSVKARFDAASYTRLKRDWEASGTLSFGIGGFSLGAGAGASGTKEDAHWNNERHEVSFTDKTTVPKIIAVTAWPPNFD